MYYILHSTVLFQRTSSVHSNNQRQSVAEYDSSSPNGSTLTYVIDDMYNRNHDITMHILRHEDSVLSVGSFESQEVMFSKLSYHTIKICVEFWYAGQQNHDRRGSVDLHLDFCRLRRRSSSVCSDTESLTNGMSSMTSIEEDMGQSSSQDGATTATVARRFRLAPLVSSFNDCSV